MEKLPAIKPSDSSTSGHGSNKRDTGGKRKVGSARGSADTGPYANITCL